MAEDFEPVDRWRTELRRRLLAARKDRDAGLTAVLRSTMSAIDNAETPDGQVPAAGATEIARRALSEDEIRSLIRGEIDERHQAAEQFARSGHADRAAALSGEAEVLAGLLSDV